MLHTKFQAEALRSKDPKKAASFQPQAASREKAMIQIRCALTPQRCCVKQKTTAWKGSGFKSSMLNTQVIRGSEQKPCWLQPYGGYLLSF